MRIQVILTVKLSDITSEIRAVAVFLIVHV